jgi:ABC-type dipeptide/oligopeptide/nickel transport system permease component
MRYFPAVSVVRTLASSAAGTALVLLFASIAIFALIRIAPGDRAGMELAIADTSSYLDATRLAELRDERRAELGLDQPLPVQYLEWLGQVVRLDLGTSYQTGAPVTTELGERLLASLALAGLAVLVALPGVLVLVALSVRRPGGFGDHGIRAGTVLFAAVPSFLSGTLALSWAARSGLPVIGPASPERIWLPALVLALGASPTLVRVLRASLLTELSQPYAEAARTRGVGSITLTFRHTLRPAVGPVLTTAGLSLATLLAGSVITEVVFTWPGVAAYAVEAIEAQDYPVVQAYVLLMVLLTVLVNRGVDLMQRLLDPRVDAGVAVVA